MSLDPTKVQFTTFHQVDKVPVYSTKTDGQGLTSHGALAVGTVTGPASFTTSVYYGTVANPYGKKCLITLSWSLDDINYYPQNFPIFYFNSTYQGYFWQALGFAGCSNSTIYVCCSTQYDIAPQTMYVQLALDSPS